MERVTVKQVFYKKVEVEISEKEAAALDGKFGIDAMCDAEQAIKTRAEAELDDIELTLSETEIT